MAGNFTSSAPVHIDSSNLIHYNGRVYDPYLGRFIQADPIVEAPTNAQSWNRYAYVFNNPLTLTDPTGYSAEGWRVFASIAISIASAGVASGVSAIIAKMSIIAVGGALSTAVATGSTKGMLWGAFSATMFYGMGNSISGLSVSESGLFGLSQAATNLAARTLAHGMLGGVMSKLQGGKFGAGFITAGVTHFASVKLNLNASSPEFRMDRVVKAALVGGTVSRITGNKFGNGAVTAAFANAFGQVADRKALEGADDVGDSVSPSRLTRRRMHLSETDDSRNMSISLTLSPGQGIDEATAQNWVTTANEGWDISIDGSDGILRTFDLDLNYVARGGDLKLLPCNATACTTGLGAAMVGGSKIWYSPSGRPNTPVHEMGHVFGFDNNRANGMGSIMSGDAVRGVQQSDFDLLWSAYKK